MPEESPVQRRTDAHTINLTMDSGTGPPPFSTPKLGSTSYQATPGATQANGLPPAYDAGSFQAHPATGRPATNRAPSQAH